MLTHIDLFSGIGGFALAARWAGFETKVFCEKDEFCQRVLIKRFGAYVADSDEPQSKAKSQDDAEVCGLSEAKCKPEYGSPISGGGAQSRGIPIISDIRDLDGIAYRGATLLTGGFPCQPFSQAGKRRGKDDDRHLWPEMLRVISEARPRWVLGENVAGIINMELDTVLADLEGEGYEVGTIVIPAAAVNAPHRRDRVWIIAYDERNGQQGKRVSVREGQEKDFDADRKARDAPDSEGPERELASRARGGGPRPPDDSWQIPWIEFAAEFCRVDDGVPDRVHRLKSLGNAIVPQVAYEIIKGIKEVESVRHQDQPEG